MKPERLIVISPLYVPDHYDKELLLIEELKRRNYTVSHLIFCDSLTKEGFPNLCFPDNAIDVLPKLSKNDCICIKSYKQLFQEIKKGNMIIVGIAKHLTFFYEYANTLPSFKLQLDDALYADVCYYGSDFVAIAEPFRKQYFRKRIDLESTQTRITGHLQVDRVHHENVKAMSRIEFCKIHNLDPNKNIVVYCPENAANSAFPIISHLYSETCRIIDSCDNCELIIKPHPRDFLKYKSDKFFNGKSTFEVLYPNAKICKPGLGYQCFNNCDLGVSTQSSVAIEFPMFKKPFIFVEPEKSPYFHNFQSSDKRSMVDFVGFICKLDELKDILISENFKNIPLEKYDHHCQEYFANTDGLVHIKIANWIEEILSNPFCKKNRPIRRLFLRLKYFYIKLKVKIKGSL